MMRWLRGLGAAAILLAVILAAPFALVSWGRYPAWSTTLLLHPDNGTLLLAALTGIGWLAWAAFTMSTAAEAVRLLGRLPASLRLPELGGLRQLSAGLLLAVLALVPATTGRVQAPQIAHSWTLPESDGASSARQGELGAAWAATEAARPSSAPTAGSARRAESQARAGSVATTDPTVRVGGRATPSSDPASAPADSIEGATPAGSEEPGRYQVQPGDDLWSVSEKLLGAGTRWREIAAANPDVLSDPTCDLVPGTRLLLPSEPASGRSTASAVSLSAEPRHEPSHVTVKHGDTLSGLARDYLGKTGRWPKIAAANPGLIDDPDHIEVGWRLAIPESPDAPGAQRVHQPDTESSTTARDGDPSRTNPTGPTPRPATSGTAAPQTSAPAPALPSAPAFSTTPTSSSAPALPTAPTVTAASTASAGATTVVPLPTAARPTAEPSGSSREPTADETVEAPAEPSPLVGTIGTLAAAAMIGVIETRRALRLRDRPLGRRLLTPDDSAVRLRVALAAEQQPEPLAAVDRTLRQIGRCCHHTGLPLPPLARITLARDRIVCTWSEPSAPPPGGFEGDESAWEIALADTVGFTGTHPCPYPAVVSLGVDDTAQMLLVDVEQSRVLGVAADDAEQQLGALTSMAVELACAPWNEGLRLIVVGPDTDLIALAGGIRVEQFADPAQAVRLLQRLAAHRREALAGAPLRALRVDPDRWDAVSPVLAVFLGEPDENTVAELERALEGEPVGVAAVVATASTTSATWQVSGSPRSPRGRLQGSTSELAAHSVPAELRESLTALFRAADSADTEPAPWSAPETADNILALPRRAEEPVDIVRIVETPDHPRLLVIGPAELQGAAGPEPARSRQQLVEACAWLLEHPGATASEMAASLGVAESTRRSNLSRLRAWLGSDRSGDPYLPEAYSGRIRLRPVVSSDWHDVLTLLAPGVERVADSTLVTALELVRGAPLADAAPGQWSWAEELRIDCAGALRDAGVVLTDRALARGEIDLARWAAARALVAAPEDELLLCARIRTEYRAGTTSEVARLVNQLTRQARVLGVDLMPETVQLCQQAVEGRIRAQQA